MGDGAEDAVGDGIHEELPLVHRFNAQDLKALPSKKRQ